MKDNNGSGIDQTSVRPIRIDRRQDVLVEKLRRQSERRQAEILFRNFTHIKASGFFTILFFLPGE